MTGLTIVPRTATEDTDTAITLTGFDGKGGNFTYFISVLPLSGTLGISSLPFEINGGSVMFRPNRHFHGRDNFTYYLQSNEHRSSPGIQSLVINPVNDAPFFSLIPPREGYINIPFAFEIHLQDVDSDERRFEVEIITTYGGAFGMNQSFLQSLSPGSILFTRGAGTQDPQIKFRVNIFIYLSNYNF